MYISISTILFVIYCVIYIFIHTQTHTSSRLVAHIFIEIHMYLLSLETLVKTQSIEKTKGSLSFSNTVIGLLNLQAIIFSSNI